jgi:hypothetical protein
MAKVEEDKARLIVLEDVKGETVTMASLVRCVSNRNGNRS